MGKVSIWMVEDDDENAGKYCCPVGVYIGGHRIVRAEKIEPSSSEPSELAIITRGYPETLDGFDIKFEFTPKTIEEARKVLETVEDFSQYMNPPEVADGKIQDCK